MKLRHLLAHVRLYIQVRLRLFKTTLAILNRLPALKQLIKRMATGNTNIQSTPSTSLHCDYLTPHARRIYTDLKAALEKNREAR